MQSILINPRITKDKILSKKEYCEISDLSEFILYSDNILEGITLLNDLTLDDCILSFYGVVYEPIDQPIYVFSDKNGMKYGIKICGAYDKWDLPKEVSQIIHFIDLPDYILYSLKNKKVILAGENTETASVGNSQWQREGRKLGAAKIGVPFIYQTFYAGRDESQDTIREPSSLQVFNQIVYSVRYKTPSFVAYFENNFENSQTRKRDPLDAKEIFVDYIKAVLFVAVNPEQTALKKKYEKLFFLHMIDYIKEPKYTDLGKKNKPPRISKDLPSLNKRVYNELIFNSAAFVDTIIGYIYEDDVNKINSFLEKSELLAFDAGKFEPWTSYNGKKNIRDLIDYLHVNHHDPKSYVKGSAKVGFVQTDLCKVFLLDKFPKAAEKINAVLDPERFPESVLMPLRIHKTSNGSLTFSPDPESGEIAAFSELFSKDLKNKKSRPVIGYCIVDTPAYFDICNKAGTKLYKALAEYVDILIIDNSKIYFSLPNDFVPSNHLPASVVDEKPHSTTEEMAVVSTYLNQSTIQSDWELCFIHTHHSSWQQLVIYKDGRAIQEKVDRVSTKVDLIMQNDNIFMIAEGKNDFQDILADGKIQKALFLASKKIDLLYKYENKQFDAFIYNLHTTPKKSPSFFVEREAGTIAKSMRMGHFNDIANHKSYVVIIVFLDENAKTGFKLVYSPDFDNELKKQLDREFRQ